MNVQTKSILIGMVLAFSLSANVLQFLASKGRKLRQSEYSALTEQQLQLKTDSILQLQVAIDQLLSIDTISENEIQHQKDSIIIMQINHQIYIDRLRNLPADSTIRQLSRFLSAAGD